MEQETINHTKKPSLFAMLWSPGEQLERIRSNPRIWGALLIVTLIYAITSTIMVMNMDISEFLDAGVPMQEADIILMIAKVTGVISGILGSIIGILISTVIYLIIVKIAKKDTTFKQLFSMNTYIMIIGAIGYLLNTIVQAIIGGSPEIYITSLAGLLNSDSLVLGTFEVFSIWQLVVTAIGSNKVGQLSKAVAWTISIVFFLISLAMVMISTTIAGLI